MSNQDYPVIVIGGGSTGTSTAYHLAKSGRKVVLIDRGQIGAGMTSKSTALVRTHYSNEIVARMALHSLRILERNKDCGFVNSGMLIIAPEDARSGIDSNLKMLSSVGIRNEIFTISEAKARFPEVELAESDTIVFEPESGYADPSATANHYARGARDLGASVLLGEFVVRLHQSNGKLTAVELSSGQKIECSEAILCTNVWTNSILERSGVPQSNLLPIWAAAHPVLILRRPEPYVGFKPSILDISNKAYYKPEGQSLFLVGSLDPELDRQSTNPESPPTNAPFEFIDSLSKSVTKRIPVMEEGSFHSSYIGMYDMTKDQHPIMDSLAPRGFEGLFCCVGLSGHGFKLSPALGLMNAEMINNQEGEFDRTAFALDRFATGKELKSKYSELGTVA